MSMSLFGEEITVKVVNLRQCEVFRMYVLKCTLKWMFVVQVRILDWTCQNIETSENHAPE